MFEQNDGWNREEEQTVYNNLALLADQTGKDAAIKDDKDEKTKVIDRTNYKKLLLEEGKAGLSKGRYLERYYLDLYKVFVVTKGRKNQM